MSTIGGLDIDETNFTYVALNIYDLGTKSYVGE